MIQSGDFFWGHLKTQERRKEGRGGEFKEVCLITSCLLPSFKAFLGGTRELGRGGTLRLSKRAYTGLCECRVWSKDKRFKQPKSGHFESTLHVNELVFWYKIHESYGEVFKCLFHSFLCSHFCLVYGVSERKLV